MERAWTQERIIAAIVERGTRLRDLDRANALRLGTCSSAIQKPSAAGERAISKFLGISAAEIWPHRYNAKDKRLKPQPATNYVSRARFAGVAA